MAPKILPKESEVADNVENLVAGRFVGEAQVIVDDFAAAIKDQQVGRGCPRSESLTPQFVRLGFQDKCSASGYFTAKLFGRDYLSMHLVGDGRLPAVIQQITDFEGVLIPGMISQRGPSLTEDHGLLDMPDWLSGPLHVDLGVHEEFDETDGRAIQTWRLGRIKFNETVINSQSGQSRQNMFDKSYLSGGLTESGAALRAGDLVNSSRDKSAWIKVAAN
jgi:hypothetical protein